MAEQLGKIEKPEASNFANKRKIYVVSLIFSGEEAPGEYVERFNLYWEQVGQHVANLESKMGKVSHVYHESIDLAGEEGLKIAEKLNPSCYRVVIDKCQGGAVFEATEDKGLTEECIDWERCLLLGLISQKVAKMVSEFYMVTLKQRYEYIARRIDETLKDGEAGLLIIRAGHMVQFPNDIEVFSVAPPALDEIHRWQRDRTTIEKEDEA